MTKPESTTAPIPHVPAALENDNHMFTHGPGDVITYPAQSCDSVKRKQILDGARQIFHRDGFDGASMNDITRAAGVSKGTVYAYFRSKEILFETVIREDRSAHVAKIFALDTSVADPATTLFKLGMELSRLIADPDSLAQLRTIIAVAAKFPTIGEAFFEAGPLAGKAHLAHYFERLHQKGQLCITNAARAANQFIDLCRSDLLMRGLLNIAPMPSIPEMEVHIYEAVQIFMKAYQPSA
jgi:AcrR family transcriptional regulator